VDDRERLQRGQNFAERHRSELDGGSQAQRHGQTTHARHAHSTSSAHEGAVAQANEASPVSRAGSSRMVE
jgi:hypothetical protein